MSIFQKICPLCASENSVDASYCVCGYLFDSSATTGSYQAVQLAVQESELYTAYLEARLQQAKDAANVAIAEQARCPGDRDMAARARQASKKLMAAEAEHAAEAAKLKVLRKEAVEANALMQKAEEAVRKQAEQAAKAAEAAKIVAEAKKAQERAEAKKAQERKKKTPPTTPPQTAKPGAALRAKLARQAENTVQTEKATQRVTHAELTADKSGLSPANNHPQTTARPKRVIAVPKRISASANAEKIKQALRKVKGNGAGATQAKKAPTGIECPHCTAVVPTKTPKCRCGYVFQNSAKDMPSVGLSAEDSAGFQQLFRPH